MRNYCTLFDSNYLVQGLLLYESLVLQSSTSFTLWILCLDIKSYQFFLKHNLPSIKPVDLSTLEEFDKEFFNTKRERNKAEYCFTSKSAFSSFIFHLDPNISSLTYLDADIFFFEDPELLFQAIGSKSIALTPHRFPKGEEQQEKNGIYNAGYIYFRNDTEGLTCLKNWRLSCINRCSDTPDGEHYADQGYLSKWPQQYSSVKILQEPGFNAALWNIRDLALNVSNNHKLLLDGYSLTFFHFHNLRQISPHLFNPSYGVYQLQPIKILNKYIYKTYLRHWRKIIRKFKLPNTAPKIERTYEPPWIKNRTLYKTLSYIRSGWLLFSF